MVLGALALVVMAALMKLTAMYVDPSQDTQDIAGIIIGVCIIMATFMVVMPSVDWILERWQIHMRRSGHRRIF